MAKTTKPKQGAEKATVCNCDLQTLIGESVRVQTEFAGDCKKYDGVLVEVLPPLPSGKGGGLRLRGLAQTTKKRAKKVRRQYPEGHPLQGKEYFPWVDVEAAEYDFCILPFTGLKSVHPLLEVDVFAEAVVNV